MPHRGEHHRKPGLVRGGDHIIVADVAGQGLGWNDWATPRRPDRLAGAQIAVVSDRRLVLARGGLRHGMLRAAAEATRP